MEQTNDHEKNEIVLPIFRSNALIMYFNNFISVLQKINQKMSFLHFSIISAYFRILCLNFKNYQNWKRQWQHWALTRFMEQYLQIYQVVGSTTPIDLQIWNRIKATRKEPLRIELLNKWQERWVNMQSKEALSTCRLIPNVICMEK